MRKRLGVVASGVYCAALLAGCGKEGPPLPPLRLVPAPVADVTARRTASEVELRFVLPTRNQNGPGQIDLERVEIYAATVVPGSSPPASRDLLTKEWLVGTVPVQRLDEEGEPIEPTPADGRPAPGDAAVFREELTPDKLKPRVTPHAEGKSGPPRAAATAAEAKTKTEAEAADTPPYPVRIYAIRGVSRSGRPGPPAPHVTVPLLDLPPPPANIGVDYTERAIALTWVAPVNTLGTPPIAFNVYSKEPTAPLNPEPLSAPRFETGPVRFGVEQCFVVRSTQVVQNVRIESDASGEACVTPRDTFPPAQPKGLTAIAGPDGISLSWTASTEADLAGYIVLRGEESAAALQRLTPEPIRDTNYRDTAISPGVTYVYRIVAVDSATPPNVSPQSDPERATAR